MLQRFFRMTILGTSVAWFGVMPSVGWAANGSVKLSKSPPPSATTLEFSEQDTVYASIRISDVPDGAHALRGQWYNGQGMQQDEVTLTIQAVQGRAGASLWLRFHPTPRLLLFMGRENWELRIFLDGKPLVSQVFYVWR